MTQPKRRLVDRRWLDYNTAAMTFRDIKPRPNHERYLEILRAMTPGQRLLKSWELTETTRKLFRAGLRHRFPHLSEEELQERYVQGLQRCRNNDC